MCHFVFMSEGVSRLLRTDRNVFCRPSLSNIEHQLAGTESPEAHPGGPVVTIVQTS
jgi:hypothetical protein